MSAVDAYISNITNLPALPEIAQRIIREANLPNPDIKAIAELVQKDPAITAKILKILNSGFFPLRTEVSSLRQAIVLMGLPQIRNIVMTTITINLFPDPNKAQFKLEDFWNHSLGVAIAAGGLGTRFKHPRAADLYLAGLLHDIGKLIIQIYHPADMDKILRKIDERRCSMFDAEQEVLGFTHADIGGRLASNWKFPPFIQESVAFHHDCEHAPEPFATALLQFSDLVVKARFYAVYGDQYLDLVFDKLACWQIIRKEGLKQEDFDLERFLFEMDDHIETARRMVQQARGG